MKKLFLVFAAMLAAAPATAAPVGNPARLSEEGNISVEAVASNVFERDLEGGEIDALREGYAKISLRPQGFPMEIYSLVGGMDLEVDQGAGGFESDFGMAYGGGTKVRFFESEESGTAIGMDAQYRRGEPDLDKNTFGSASGELLYQDWQAALGVSQKIGPLTPYGGVRYSDVDISDVPGFADRNSDDVMGYFAGVDLEAIPNMYLNVEGSAGSDEAVTASLAFKF